MLNYRTDPQSIFNTARNITILWSDPTSFEPTAHSDELLGITLLPTTSPARSRMGPKSIVDGTPNRALQKPSTPRTLVLEEENDSSSDSGTQVDTRATAHQRSSSASTSSRATTRPQQPDPAPINISSNYGIPRNTTPNAHPGVHHGTANPAVPNSWKIPRVPPYRRPVPRIGPIMPARTAANTDNISNYSEARTIVARTARPSTQNQIISTGTIMNKNETTHFTIDCFMPTGSSATFTVNGSGNHRQANSPATQCPFKEQIRRLRKTNSPIILKINKANSPQGKYFIDEHSVIDQRQPPYHSPETCKDFKITIDNIETKFVCLLAISAKKEVYTHLIGHKDPRNWIVWKNKPFIALYDHPISQRTLALIRATVLPENDVIPNYTEDDE